MRNHLGMSDWSLRAVARKGGGSGGGGGTQTVVNKTELPQWVTDAAKKNLDQAYQVSQNLAKPYEGPRVADLTGAQYGNINSLQGNVGQTNPAFSAAQTRTAQLMGYDPIMVAAQQIGADQDYERVAAGSYNPAMISNPGSIRADQINPSYLADTNLSAYMNPYTDSVIGSGMRAIDVQRQQALNQNADAAIKAGAFGGGRHGVIDAVTNTGAINQAGNLAAQLQAQNFAQAQQAATGDITRNFAGQQANQGANLQAGTTNLQAMLQTLTGNQNAANRASEFNVGTNLQGQLANQSAGLQAQAQRLQAQQGNQNAALQAAMANQGAGLQGAGLNLGAANQLGNLAGQGQQAFLQSLMAAMGGQDAIQNHNQAKLGADQALYNEQKNYPLEQLQIPLMALGMTPYGQTQTQTATGLPMQSSNGLLQGLGGASAGIGILGSLFGGGGIFPGALAGLFGGSDREMKTDIKKIGEDEETGLPLYSYRYKGDPKSYPKVVGPMAQDVAKKFPDQVRKVGDKLGVSLSFGPMAKAFER